MTENVSPEPAATIPAINSTADAEALCHEIETTMVALSDIIEQESALVRKSKISETAELENQKADLARRYVADMKVVKAHRDQLKALAPAAMDRLRDLNDAFHSELQINLAVLATAKAVAEDIVRGVSDAVNRQNRIPGYSRDGRAQPRTYSSAGAIAVDRST
ncbi:MAG: hypothetical protein KDJ16_07390 [Hyphomicrobiales bacterium]|nr:hypothetical protein [Hyphomicrobiales bacterium]